jgi:hypothetical protein
VEELHFRQGPEIVVGLVGPVGTNLDAVKHALEDELSTVKYRVEHLRLSDLLAEIFGTPGGLDHDERISRLMDQGDALRKLTDHPDAVALLAIAEIRRIREKKTGNQDPSIQTICCGMRIPQRPIWRTFL